MTMLNLFNSSLTGPNRGESSSFPINDFAPLVFHSLPRKCNASGTMWDKASTLWFQKPGVLSS